MQSRAGGRGVPSVVINQDGGLAGAGGHTAFTPCLCSFLGASGGGGGVTIGNKMLNQVDLLGWHPARVSQRP